MEPLRARGEQGDPQFTFTLNSPAFIVLAVPGLAGTFSMPLCLCLPLPSSQLTHLAELPDLNATEDVASV